MVILIHQKFILVHQNQYGGNVQEIIHSSSPNEAREALSFDPVDGYDDLRVPANIAGSAANPDEGGRPVEEGEDDG